MVTTPSTSPLPFCTKVTIWPLAVSIRFVVELLMLNAKVSDCWPTGASTVNGTRPVATVEPAGACPDPATLLVATVRKLSSTTSPGTNPATIVGRGGDGGLGGKTFSAVPV